MGNAIDVVICPHCGKRSSQSENPRRDFCVDCGEDMNIRLGVGFSTSGFAYPREDIIDSHVRENWD
jgi:hypothetical protein